MRTDFLAPRKLLKLHIRIVLSFLLLSASFGQTGDRIPVDITFQSQGHSLRGRFFEGSTNGGVTIILLQGFPGNPQDVLGLGQRLSNSGFNVLTFNYGGTHRSEGEMNYPTESSMVSKIKTLNAPRCGE